MLICLAVFLVACTLGLGTLAVRVKQTLIDDARSGTRGYF
ncbi:hypothetical protein LKMONMHP_2152 [Methylobacterium organophilum]|uniref:Uncharacterized protein n=1 Tax=Methylobacterium organophilum TaxID=410 RepID=A0ABQ4T9Y1_METOR|nr:hypothetical protein LKMONMHP_2152 [Methylobacterium organophilum]